MVVNVPPLTFILTILLAFAILYTSLVYLSGWSMDHMPHSCLMITFWLSILLSFLPLKSNFDLTFSIIVALGNPNQRALSSFCTWMVIIILLVFWPRSAHITRGSPSWSLFYSVMIWTFSGSKLFLMGVKTGFQHPLSLTLRQLPSSPSNLTYGIS